MIYRLLADALVVIHLAFVFFVVGGGWLTLRWRWLVWLHVPAALWGATIEFMGWICPLTPWENRLRIAGGEAGYEGGFIEHYVLPLLYPANLTRQTQIVLGLFVILINVVAYGLFFRRYRLRASTEAP